MPPRRFNVDEAARLLPRLTDLVQTMQTLKREHDHLQETVRDIERKMASDGHLVEAELGPARQQMAEKAAELKRLVEDAEALGCELKDIDQGLVDFRTVMDGREVYLCWRLGEPEIAWWHELETGYRGRRPLPERP